jgi:hypothetical protein
MEEAATAFGVDIAVESFSNDFAKFAANNRSHKSCLPGMSQEVDRLVHALDFATTLLNLSARMVSKADEKALLTTLQHRLKDLMSDASLAGNRARRYVTTICPSDTTVTAKLEEFERLIHATVDTFGPFVTRVEAAARAN